MMHRSDGAGNMSLRVGGQTSTALARVFEMMASAAPDLCHPSARSRRSGSLEGAEALKLFERFKKKIESVVDRKLKLGHFEADGSIIIRNVDLTC